MLRPGCEMGESARPSALDASTSRRRPCTSAGVVVQLSSSCCSAGPIRSSGVECGMAVAWQGMGQREQVSARVGVKAQRPGERLQDLL